MEMSTTPATQKKVDDREAVRNAKIAEMYANYGIFMILVIIFLCASMFVDKFCTVSNLLSVINQNSITVILACGMTMLIISANIDLSAGYVMIMANVACAYLITTTGSVLIGILGAVAIAVVAEIFNGLAISYVGLNGFIVTLATLFVFKGVSLLICGGTPIYGVPGITVLAQSKVFGVIPILIVFMVIAAIIVHFILSRTSYGRYLYAIGGNANAARAAGINVKRTVLINFIVMGICAGIAGVLFTARANSGQPNSADTTFDAIIATVLGGTSMVGGSGFIVGTVAGALVVGIINNVMNLGGISPYYQNIVKGLIIFLAILIDKKTRDAIMHA